MMIFRSLFTDLRGGDRFARLLAAVALGLLAGSAHASTYYVSTSGNDANSGTSERPWRTIQRAASIASAGDTVIVRPGTYNESVRPQRDGLPGAYITFKGESYPTNAQFYLTNSYIRIEGFYLNGTNCQTYTSAISYASGANYCQAVSNIIAYTPYMIAAVGMDDGPPPPLKPHHNWVEGNRVLNINAHNFVLAGYHHVLTNNYVECTNGWDAILMAASDSIITGNVFTNISNFGNKNHTDIIQAWSNNGEVSTNIVFERNLVINCVRCQIGMLSDVALRGLIGWWTFRNNMIVNVEAAFSMYVHDVYWYNNTFYRSGRNTGHPVLFRSSTNRGIAHNGRVLNNIFVECGSDPANSSRGWYGADPACTKFVADYTFVSGTGGLAKGGFREEHGMTGGQPGFVDPQSNNFSLVYGSLIVDKGMTIEGAEVDYFGTVRLPGSAWDIGACELRPRRPRTPVGALPAR